MEEPMAALFKPSAYREPQMTRLCKLAHPSRGQRNRHRAGRRARLSGIATRRSALVDSFISPWRRLSSSPQPTTRLPIRSHSFPTKWLAGTTNVPLASTSHVPVARFRTRRCAQVDAP
jgi:hypothetical protein